MILSSEHFKDGMVIMTEVVTALRSTIFVQTSSNKSRYNGHIQIRQVKEDPNGNK